MELAAVSGAVAVTVHLPPLRDADPRAELAMLAERRRQLREELAWVEAVMADLAGEIVEEKGEPMAIIRDIQAAQAEWQRHNFPNGEAVECILGIQEECGELAHAFLKRRQGIRGDADTHIADMRDAVGDIGIFALGLCNYMGWDYTEILVETWRQVQQRDWTRDVS